MLFGKCHCIVKALKIIFLNKCVVKEIKFTQRCDHVQSCQYTVHVSAWMVSTWVTRVIQDILETINKTFKTNNEERPRGPGPPFRPLLFASPPPPPIFIFPQTSSKEVTVPRYCSGTRGFFATSAEETVPKQASLYTCIIFFWMSAQ